MITKENQNPVKSEVTRMRIGEFWYRLEIVDKFDADKSVNHYSAGFQFGDEIAFGARIGFCMKMHRACLSRCMREIRELDRTFGQDNIIIYYRVRYLSFPLISRALIYPSVENVRYEFSRRKMENPSNSVSLHQSNSFLFLSLFLFLCVRLFPSRRKVDEKQS